MSEKTGYMGFPEPEVVPIGPPSHTPPSEQTYTPMNSEPSNEPPAADAPPATPPPASEPPAAEPPAAVAPPEPQVVEKIVEKIVEKYPEFKDEKAKTLYDAWTNGDFDAVKNYIKEIDKNYDTMAHVDIVREGLAKKNPQWSASDVELELRSEYGAQLEPYNMDDIDKELNPDVYKEALAHNQKVEANRLKLERDARDFRIGLKEGQKAVELPKLTKEETTTPPAIQPPTQAEIDESKRKWADAAQEQVQALADYKFQVGDDKNPEEVAFVITPEEKSARVEAMKSWSGADFMSQRKWLNDDGSFNILSIAKDVHALDNMDKIVKSAYSQGMTAGKKETVSKDIKNLDLEHTRASDNPGQPVNAGDLVWG